MKPILQVGRDRRARRCPVERGAWGAWSVTCTPGTRALPLLLLAALWLPVPAATAADLPASPPPLPKIRIAADGATFATDKGRRFVPFGINYFRPGTGWAPKLWQQFDAEATARDFARMRELGVNCVRVFLSFGSFYMEPGVLSAEGLQKFDRFLALAEQAGIYVHPTGPDHWEGSPPWARGDRIADEPVLKALEAFWTQFAARYRGRNVIFAYDLLNEPAVHWDSPSLRAKWNQWLRQQYQSEENLAAAWRVPAEGLHFGQVPVPAAKDAPRDPQLLAYQHFRESVADEWTRRQVAALKAADPAALVTVGFIQWSVPSLLPGVRNYAAFRPDRQARFLDFMEVHFYPLDKGFFEYTNPADEERNLAYAQGVVREVARTGKPVVVAEFGWYGGGQLTIDGGKHPPATEEQQARWCRRLIESTSGLATGWLNWGLYDHPQARDVTQLTGLLTSDGKLKAWGREFSLLAPRLTQAAFRRAPLDSPPLLDWDLCLTSTQAGNQFRDQFFKNRR